MARFDMAVGLGANAGDRRAALAEAVSGLRGMGEVVAVSGLYESAARELAPDADGADRAPYLNAVVRLRSHLPPEAVLAACLAHEAASGRDRQSERRHGARAVDVDLLLCGSEVRQAPFLRLPHPRMATRPFVLWPLHEIWPDAPRPGGRSWPAVGWGAPAELLRLAGPEWAVRDGEAPPAPGQDLMAEAARFAARGEAPLYAFGEVGSTADVLRILSLAGARHGTAVTAESQRFGRGRHGRVWWAPPYGSLLLSVLLRDVADLGGLVPLLCGLAVVEAVDAAGGGSLGLKWPNDVVLPDGRKVAGVLVERMGDGSVLVGIGTNVRPLADSAPPDVLARSASLTEAGTPPPRDRLLRHLVSRLRSLGDEARARGPTVLVDRWRERSATLGRPVTVHPVGGGEPIAGVAASIAVDGALVVRLSDGQERLVHAGEVTLTPPGVQAAPAGPRS